MFGSASVNIFLLCISIVNSQLGESFKSGWVPLNYSERPIPNTNTERSILKKSFTPTTETIWKQAQPTGNIHAIQEEAIQVVNPPQIHRKKGITFFFSTPNVNEAIDFAGTDYNNNQDNKDFETTEAQSLEETSKFKENELLKQTELPVNETFTTTENLKLSELQSNTKLNSSAFSDSSHFVTVKSNTNEELVVSEFQNNVRLNNSAYSESQLPKNVTFNTTAFSRLPKKENISEVKDLSNSPTNVNLNTSEVLPGSIPESLRRKSKQIQNHDFVNYIDNLGDTTAADKVEAAESSTYLISIKNNKKYEVTEASTTAETGDETTDFNQGYIYKQPLITPLGLIPSRNAITNRLLDNLSKYNIKVNDFLNNYPASKTRVHQENLIKNIQHSPVPAVISIPFRYNSLNHLPVNPLLAAYLSNYGYYLQSSFGRPNNYKNLYGYSASNNIHNNKPFGSYKIYSDTDANQ